MAGLVTASRVYPTCALNDAQLGGPSCGATYVFLREHPKEDVDARHKAGHDGGWARHCAWAADPPVFITFRSCTLRRDVSGGAQGPRDDRSERIARTRRGVAALDRGRRATGLGVARRDFRPRARCGAEDPRMGRGRSRSRTAGTLACLR